MTDKGELRCTGSEAERPLSTQPSRTSNGSGPTPGEMNERRLSGSDKPALNGRYGVSK